MHWLFHNRFVVLWRPKGAALVETSFLCGIKTFLRVVCGRVEWLFLPRKYLCLTQFVFPVFPGDFPALRSCSVLFLDGNPLEDIEAGALQTLSNLDELNLSGVRLPTIRGDMWIGLNNLELLWLYDAGVTTLQPGAFKPLSRVTVIQMNNCPLESVAADMWEGLSSLNTLGLYGCGLGLVPEGAFSSLPSLQILSLANNGLTTILPRTFAGLSNLKNLLLDNNELDCFEPGTFSGNPLIDLLSLKKNNFTSIGDIPLSELQSLWGVYLEGNAITSIEEEDLQGCPESLSELYLQSNQISCIESGTFSHCPDLTDLKLEDNQLTTLSEYAFGPGYFRERSLILFLYLKGNPMVCGTELCWLKRAEAKRWLTLGWKGFFGPECVNMPGVDWEDVDLGC